MIRSRRALANLLFSGFDKFKRKPAATPPRSTGPEGSGGQSDPAQTGPEKPDPRNNSSPPPEPNSKLRRKNLLKNVKRNKLSVIKSRLIGGYLFAAKSNPLLPLPNNNRSRIFPKQLLRYHFMMQAVFRRKFKPEQAQPEPQAEKEEQPEQAPAKGKAKQRRQQEGFPTNKLIKALGLLLFILLITSDSDHISTNFVNHLQPYFNNPDVKAIEFSASNLKKLKVRLLLKDGNSILLGSQVNSVEQLDKLLAKIRIDVPVSFKIEESKIQFLPNLPYIVVGCTLLYYLPRVKLTFDFKGTFSNMGKNNSKVKAIPPSLIKVDFSKVAGLTEAKIEIKEFVEFLKAPQRYIQLGARMPRGALLFGPPGTGKTLLGKACAKEAGVPFFYASGSQFVEVYVGVGAQRVRQLFKKAKQQAPSIIFIDEIDAIGRKRSEMVSNHERETTLNQLLVQMDGFDTSNQVVVLAATNRKDILDAALLRPGRFDRSIQISLPNFEERKAVLEIYLSKLKLRNGKSQKLVYAKKLATLTTGCSGADLENICNEGAVIAARRDSKHVMYSDLADAIDRVGAGFLKKRNASAKQLAGLLSYHYAGCALVSWMLESTPPVLKISLASRSKSSNGYVTFQKADLGIKGQSEIMGSICVQLAGMAAEQMMTGRVSTLSEEKMKNVRELTNAFVKEYGMSKGLPLLSIDTEKREASDWLLTRIQQEERSLLDQCQGEVDRLLTSNRDKLQQLAKRLREKQTIEMEEIKSILGDKVSRDLSKFKAYSELIKPAKATVS